MPLFRNGNNSKLKVILLILATVAIIAIVLYFLWKKGILAKAKVKLLALFKKNGTIDGTITPTPPEKVSFPVRLSSKPADILAAMEQSGYIETQKQYFISMDGGLDMVDPAYGMTGNQYIARIYADPVTDLRNHTYVYTLYPTYFAQ